MSRDYDYGYIPFDSQGRRLRRLSALELSTMGHQLSEPAFGHGANHHFRPGFIAVRGRGGYRLSRVQATVHAFVTVSWMAGAMPPAVRGERRFPNVASVEMYLRHTVRS